MKKLTNIRLLSQVLIVAIISYIGVRHQIVGGGPNGSAPLDSYCPFGGIETAFAYFQTGQFLDKTNVSNFVLLISVLIMSFIAGSAFCSWLCPLGAIQEWLAKLGKRFFGRTYSFPMSIHKSLRHLRFVTLLAIVYLTVQGSRLVFEEYDPFKILFHFNFETTTAIVIFCITIVLSLLIDRFWCKYLCPLGAVFSLAGRFNLINIRRNTDLCVECGTCTKKCPMNIEVTKVTNIPADECVKCLECISTCPKSDALVLTVGGSRK